LHDRQAGHSLEVAEIGRAYAVAEFECRYADEQIGKSDSHSLRLILTIDFSCAKG
jgi:dGTP triphosphohydrolase